MTVNEIRQKYLEYFKGKGHAIIPSSSLVPENDPTTLFTGSGMQPLMPYFLGSPHPKGVRVTDSQKSFRAEDIEEVGDNRHTTFFEMLGNWSFGDYFKEEQLQWFFEFLTKELGLDPEKLYVSVYAGDESLGVPRDRESVAIWQKLFAAKNIEAKDVVLGTEEEGGRFGMQGGRIFYYSKKNWWSRAGSPEKMPVGEPGGPDSEVFYRFDNIEHDVKFGEYCHPNCDCGRFLEVGNSVFMQYIKKEDGTFAELPKRNVDFGGGLERQAAVSQGVNDVFRIDCFAPVINKLEELTARVYGNHTDVFHKQAGDADILRDRRGMRIIADHLRAATFMLGDGVFPSNKDRGYILRRLIRRAVAELTRMAPDAAPTWASDIAKTYIAYYGSYYTALAEQEMAICEQLTAEVKKFLGTIENGNKILSKILAAGSNVSGADAFVLFTTYGFPLELTREKAAEVNLSVDEEAYRSEFEKHQELSRTATAGAFKGGLADSGEMNIRLHTATHLMNAALRKVLGENVWQKGSNINPERLRFDFTHNQKMTDEEKSKVESLVNDWIKRDLAVHKDVLPLEEARKLGAIGVFGEKYPDTVNVYSVVDNTSGEVISREFCGGPHVSHTGEIGKFKILKEEAVAAGIRRIKASVE
jgi:alanyl-tRNA synthetase